MRGRVALLTVAGILAVVAIGGTWLANRMADAARAIEFLPPRELETFTAIFVGTGGAHENPRRRGPALAVGRGRDLLLVDAGRGVAEGLRAARIPPHQPRTILLTSLLPDSSAGLDDLLAAGWLAGRDEPLRVVGPPGTADLVAGLEAAHRQGLAGQGEALGLSREGARLVAREVADGEVLRLGGLEVQVADLPGGPVPARAYRIETEGAAVVAVGRAWGEEALVELARGANLLVHEAFFAESVEMALEAGASEPERLRRDAALRTPLAEAGRRARRAGVGALALVRMRPPPLFDFQATRVAGETYRGRLLVPEDGEEVTLTPGSRAPEVSERDRPPSAADRSSDPAAPGDRPGGARP